MRACIDSEGLGVHGWFVDAQVSLQLNEVFDIDMVFDSWWFLPDKKMPPKLQQHAKALSLNVPVQGR